MAAGKATLKPRPKWATAALVLQDGSLFWGRGFGAVGKGIGEVCFNTSMTGYQEILTDPSYAGQIISFTFPHIGNVGCNIQDIETQTPFVRGLVLRQDITQPSNWRAMGSLDDWLKRQDLVAIAGIDTRRLTRRIRSTGAPGGVVCHQPLGDFEISELRAAAADWPGLAGMDLAAEVSCRQSYDWRETTWSRQQGYGQLQDPRFQVVAIDYGIKHNILRSLATRDCAVTVVPADYPADNILARNPDGIFLSNGPGDPAATGRYAIPIVQDLIASGKPIFGICLGHQILALALGAKTHKMHVGHRGANHPVKDLQTGKVEITSQNHGFVVDQQSLPDGVEASHISLFDGGLEGLTVTGKPIFSVQYHPEASPGPQDSHYLFDRFIETMQGQR